MKKLDTDRLLLIHSYGSAQNAQSRNISRLANIMPPLGIMSIAAYLQAHGKTADIIDCYAHPNSDGHIQAYLREKRPGYIGFTCTTPIFNDSVRIARMARQMIPEIRTIFGGAHISALRQKILEISPVADYAVIGEGEEGVLDVMNANNDTQALSFIPGLVYRDDGQIMFTGLRNHDQLMDLDTLPFPAYDKLAGYPKAYTLPIFNYPYVPNTCCSSSRGCPYTCSYCDRSVFRRSFRYNSAEYLYEHMLYLRERFGIRHVNFYDDQFTFHRGRVEKFCQQMIEGDLRMSFNCVIRAEHADYELLKLMKKAGCWMISLGIETGDPELLAQHRQNPDLEMMARRIREIKRAGIRTKGLLMMALPGESETSIRRSMEYVFSLPIDDFNLAKFTPFPGSPLYAGIRELGNFEEDWDKMDCMSFQFVPKGMTRSQLDRLFLEFYKNHYKRSRVLWGYVQMLWKSPNSWWRFLLNLASFLRFAFSQGKNTQEQKQIRKE